jgi:hypothetical protein
VIKYLTGAVEERGWGNWREEWTGGEARFATLQSRARGGDAKVRHRAAARTFFEVKYLDRALWKKGDGELVRGAGGGWK